MLTLFILAFEFARLALEFRDGVPSSRVDRAIVLLGVALLALTIYEALT